MLEGWRCPVCGNVYAPTVARCYEDHTETRLTNVTVMVAPRCSCKVTALGREPTTALCPVHGAA